MPNGWPDRASARVAAAPLSPTASPNEFADDQYTPCPLPYFNISDSTTSSALESCTPLRVMLVSQSCRLGRFSRHRRPFVGRYPSSAMLNGHSPSFRLYAERFIVHSGFLRHVDQGAVFDLVFLAYPVLGDNHGCVGLWAAAYPVCRASSSRRSASGRRCWLRLPCRPGCGDLRRARGTSIPW